MSSHRMVQFPKMCTKISFKDNGCKEDDVQGRTQVLRARCTDITGKYNCSKKDYVKGEFN